MPIDDEEKAYREHLQRRLSILEKQLRKGKVFIADGLDMSDSFQKARKLPDGSYDLETIDSRIRSMALAVEFFEDRREMKASVSLQDIQNAYFSIIDKNFGKIYEMMVEKKLSPNQVAMGASRDKNFVRDVSGISDNFLGYISEFWENYGPIAVAHVEDDFKSLKGVFGGDLFPSHDESVASKCGLYNDTIILPDPFIRSKHIYQSETPEQITYFMVKHGTSILRYKELACAEIAPPIVLILPEYYVINESEKDLYATLGKNDAVIHAEHVFGRSFDSFEEMIDFCYHFDSIDKIVPEIREPSRVLFDTNWTGTLAEQFEKVLSDSPYSSILHLNNPGKIVAQQAFGRMSVCNELIVKSQRLRGAPLIEAPTSWQYFVWKLEYDGEYASKISSVSDLHIVRGLQSLAEHEMVWLGNIPHQALIEIRKNGALEEIRNILGQGVAELINADKINFHRTTDKVLDNLHAAFDGHERKIQELKNKRWKFAGSHVGSWLVKGSLAIAAAATGDYGWGIAFFAYDEIVGPPKIKDLPARFREMASESRELKRSPVGMLFDIGR